MLLSCDVFTPFLNFGKSVMNPENDLYQFTQKGTYGGDSRTSVYRRNKNRATEG